MSVNLITGNLFSPIQASQDSDYQAGTFGTKTQILNVGSKMAVSIVDNSTIRCEDGVLVTREGRRVQIDNGDVVEWTIPTGTQGTTSYYIVGFRLYTDNESAQLCDTFIQSVAGPGATIAEDTFRDGAVEIFVSVARVVQNGITLESIQQLIPTAMTTDDTKSAISQLNSDLTDTAGHLQNEIDDINDKTRTNLLNPIAQTQTTNGVTCTNNGDGTYTVNGTASGRAYFYLEGFDDFSILENTKLVGCPVGGSKQTYCMYITCFSNSTWLKDYDDYGNGVIVSNIPSQANTVKLHIYIKKGTTCNNLLFKPMVTTDLNAKYDDYVPYTGDSGRLNEDVSQINSDLTYKPITGLPSTAQSSITVPLPANFKEMVLLVKVGGNASWTLSSTIYACAVPTSGSYTLREGQSFYYGAGQTRYDVTANFAVSATSVTVDGSLSANNVTSASTVLVAGWYR